MSEINDDYESEDMIDSHFYNTLMKLPRRNLINLMWNSVKEMKVDSEQSIMSAIMYSVDANPLNDDSWESLTLSELKSVTTFPFIVGKPNIIKNSEE